MFALFLTLHASTQLREFFLRFSPLMSVGITYLEDLDIYETLSESCAKTLLVNVLDLIAADAEGPVKTVSISVISVKSSLTLVSRF